MPKFNGHYPDIPEGTVPLTNRELERLRQKYGDAAFEPDEDSAGGLEEPVADISPAADSEAGGDAAGAQGSAEPVTAAQDPLPELEPEPVSEDEPDPADETPADYSGFFTGADDLLEDLDPEAAAAAFARYIGGLSFDPQRGAVTAETEWSAPSPAAALEPPAARAQAAAVIPGDNPAEGKRPARAKKTPFFSGRKARGTTPRPLKTAADGPVQSSVSPPAPVEDRDDTGFAAGGDIDEPAGFTPPLPAQNEPEVPVEMTSDTGELDFTQKYLLYDIPAAGDVPAAQAQDLRVAEDTPAAPAAMPGETAAQEPLPAEEDVIETIIAQENDSATADEPETPAADSAQKHLSYWEKRKQRKAVKGDAATITAQPAAEAETDELAPVNPLEQSAPVEPASEVAAQLSEPVPPAETPAPPEDIVPGTQEPNFEATEPPAQDEAPAPAPEDAAQANEPAGGEDTPPAPAEDAAEEPLPVEEAPAQEPLPVEESNTETVLAEVSDAVPVDEPETPAADSAQKHLSYWEKRKQRKAVKDDAKIIPAQPSAEAETDELAPVNPLEQSAPVEPAAEDAAETAEPVPPAETSAPPEDIVPEMQESGVESIEPPAQAEAPAPVQEEAAPPEADEPGGVQDTLPASVEEAPVQEPLPAQEAPADAAAPGTAQEDTAAEQEISAEAGEEPAESPEDTAESDIADTGSGEAIEAEKPQSENIRPQMPVSPPKGPPDAGMRIIYRAPEAAAFDTGGPAAKPAEDRNNGKAGPAGLSSYNKYIRVIYQAPGSAFPEGSEAAQPEPAQAAPAEETTPQGPGSEEQETSIPPAAEENAVVPADTAQASAAQQAAEETGGEPTHDTGETEAAETVTQAPDKEPAAEEPGVEQPHVDGVLAGLAAEKTPGRFKRFLRAFFPQKTDSAAEKIRKSVLVLATLTIFVCGGILLNSYIIEPAMSNRQIAKAIELKQNSSLDKNWPDIQSKYAGVDFPQGMLPRYAGLYVANRDFTGWLTIEGLGIDMPLVQGETNGDYLRTDFYGKPSRYGCCFFDYRSSIQTLGRNTIVYGHNMGSSDLLMFGNLEKYSRIDGFKAAPVIECNTLYTLMKWKVYAVFVTNSLPSQDNGYLFNYIFPEMESDDDFAGYIAQLDRRKLYTTGVDLLKSDRILTLSTCSYEFDDARLVVVARLVRPGESEKADTSLAAVNPSPKYPQIWYDKNGQTNPYRNDEPWYP